MSEHREPHERGVERLERELQSRFEEALVAIEFSDLRKAREIGGSLARHGQPPEFRLEGLHILAKVSAEQGATDEALHLLEEARQLAIDTGSYYQASEIQGTVFAVHRVQTKDTAQADEAYGLLRYYEECAERFDSCRFRNIGTYDDHEG